MSHTRNNPLSYVDSSGQKFTPVQAAKVATIKVTLKLDDNKFVIGTPSLRRPAVRRVLRQAPGAAWSNGALLAQPTEGGLARQAFAEKFGTKRMLGVALLR